MPPQHVRQMSHDGEPLIDLHGQHAAEGVATLRRELARLRSSQQSPATAKAGAAQQTVYVLVGTGHHTKARLSTTLRAQPLSFCPPVTSRHH